MKLANNNIIRFSLITMLLLGLLHNILLPLAAVPDEKTHFCQAYALSNRVMGIQSVFSEGLIVTEKALRTDSEVGLSAKSDNINDVDSLLYFWKTKVIDDKENLVPDSGYIIDDNLVITAYIPPALGITFARLVGMSWQYIYIAGRIFNLLFFILIMYIAMRSCHAFVDVVAAIGLLPSVIWLAASYSYDGWNIALSVLFVVLCIRIGNKKGMVNVCDILALLLVFLLLVPIKYVYVFLVLSILLIPKRKWPKWIIAFVGIGIVIVIVLLYAFRGREIYRYLATESMDTRGMTNDSMQDGSGYELSYTFSYVLTNPYRVFLVFINTLISNIDEYIVNCIGGEFYTSYVPETITYLTLMIFLVVMATSVGGNLYLEDKKIFIVASSILFLVCITIFAAFLFTFSQINNSVIGQISGIQGRYFIPVFICFPLVMHSKKLRNWLVNSSFGDNYSYKLIVVIAVLSIISFIFKSVGLLSA